MDRLNLEITVDPTLPNVVEGAVSFETGSPTTSLHVYGPNRPLLSFFEDLISGAPMPLLFATHKIAGPHTIVAATLFFCRDLAIHGATPGFVYLVDLAHHVGDTMLAHSPDDMARFLRGLSSFFPEGLSRQEQGQRLTSAMQWVRAYILEGTTPNLGPYSSEYPKTLDTGTNGFVIAEGVASRLSWEQLFREGWLRGFVLEPGAGTHHILAARKSHLVGFDLERAVPILDELETLSGNRPGWKVEGNYLASPPQGTTVEIKYITEVFLRS